MSENVVVICWQNGTVGDVFAEPKENAIKRCLANNMAELVALADDGGTEDDAKEVILKIFDLMKNDKWDEADKMWQETDMTGFMQLEVEDFMEWRPTTTPEDVNKSLEWIKNN